MKKRRFLACFLLVFVISFAFSVVASADTGPKPSVRITIQGLSEPAYATLLSERKSTGPHSAWDGSEEMAIHDSNTPYDIWEAFVTYEDADGYYFLQQTEQRVKANGECAWVYYPPERFKLLLYFPESDTFAVSAIYDRYAFHSYFTATVDEADASLSLVKSYDYMAETVGLLARIGITLLIELLLALFFFMKEKKLLLPIAVFNVATQILLNLLLAWIGYKNGELAFMLRYIGCEILVTVIEVLLLCFLAPRLSQRPGVQRRAILYAVLANLSSLFLGLWISLYLPGIF